MEEYKVSPEGTSYDIDTPEHIMLAVDRAIKTRARVKIKYKDGYEDFTGYTKDGLNVSMYIGRSTGTSKIPLHIISSRSMGGVALCTNLIESIKFK